MITGSNLPKQCGDGRHGTIIVTGASVSIIHIYEDDNCVGVITNRGVDKGLNHGAGTYDPYSIYNSLNCANLIVNAGCTLTTDVTRSASATQGGIVVVRATDSITNYGTISANAVGFLGGLGYFVSNPGSDNRLGDDGTGTGPGLGHNPTGGAGGIQYNYPIQTITDNSFGSGGGGGDADYTASLATGWAVGGTGGTGGGIVLLYCNNIDNKGIVCAEAAVGGYGQLHVTSGAPVLNASGGGGGSGGTVKIFANTIISGGTVSSVGKVGGVSVRVNGDNGWAGGGAGGNSGAGTGGGYSNPGGNGANGIVVCNKVITSTPAAIFAEAF